MQIDGKKKVCNFSFLLLSPEKHDTQLTL